MSAIHKYSSNIVLQGKERSGNVSASLASLRESWERHSFMTVVFPPVLFRTPPQSLTAPYSPGTGTDQKCAAMSDGLSSLFKVWWVVAPGRLFCIDMTSSLTWILSSLRL
jgi:hypothetical protein